MLAGVIIIIFLIGLRYCWRCKCDGDICKVRNKKHYQTEMMKSTNKMIERMDAMTKKMDTITEHLQALVYTPNGHMYQEAKANFSTLVQKTER